MGGEAAHRGRLGACRPPRRSAGLPRRSAVAHQGRNAASGLRIPLSRRRRHVAMGPPVRHALRRRDGRAYRVVGAAVDITEIKQRDAELQAARAETERHARADAGAARQHARRRRVGRGGWHLHHLEQGDVRACRYSPRAVVALGTMQNIWRWQYENDLVPRIAPDRRRACGAAIRAVRSRRRQPAGAPAAGRQLGRALLPADAGRTPPCGGARHHRTEAARDRVGARARRGRGGARRGGSREPGEVHLPRHHEPRDPHADERRARHARGAGAPGPRRDAARHRRDDPRLGAMRCCASSTTCSISRRSRPAGSSWRRRAFSLSGLVAGAVQTFRRQADRQGAAHRRAVRSGSDDALLGDPIRVRQILFNLLGNASSSPSAAACGCAPAPRRSASGRTARDADGGRYRHRHRRGAARAAVPAVRPGRQLDHAPLRRHRPWPVDRAPACAADGRRRDGEEHAGRGSEFTVTLLLQAAPGDRRSALLRRARPPVTPLADIAGGGRVLVVDDHPVNREVLVRQLGLLGLDGRYRGGRRRGAGAVAAGPLCRGARRHPHAAHGRL